MKKYTFLTLFSLAFQFLFAQSPQSFQYQAVVHNALGNPVANQNVGFKISIIPGSVGGVAEYVETHNASTNAFGIVTLNIGNGITSGNFANINWGGTLHFIKVEADPAGGTSYLDMGTTQLLSVPYAIYAQSSGNGDTLWNINGNNIYNSNIGNVGVGLNNPAGKMVIKGSSTASASEPLFEVKNSIGQSVFVVYQDSVNVFVNDDVIQSNRGGFAVSGRNNSKAITNKYLYVTPDNSKIWTKDTLLGFGVENISGSNSNSYMQLTPNNYFIGHQSGSSITFGLHNSFMGFHSGINNTTGNDNTFLGYKTGYNNVSGNGNIAIGPAAGYNNFNGHYNTFVGDSAGYSNSGGWYNVFVGYAAGKSNLANNNTFVGTGSGEYNSIGQNNTFYGNSSGFNNTTGHDNTMIGLVAGSTNESGHYNTYLGGYSGNGGNGYAPTIGNKNVFIGFNSGYNVINSSNNTYIGTNSGFMNQYGVGNVFVGNRAGFSETGSNKLYISNGMTIDSTLLYGDFNTKILYTKAKMSINSTLTPTSYLEVVDLTINNDNPAVLGRHNITDNWGIGVKGEGSYQGVYGSASSATGFNYGVYGSAGGVGTGTRYGVYGTATGGTTAYAGYFLGNVHVQGTLSKSAGTFRIDHPLDPENKYLVHSFVESPDMKNVYDGEIILDNTGSAVVELPSYFESLNKDFRYQLTSIGAPAPNLFIKQRIESNKFIISGGTAGLSVSWQVTGIRKDPYAEKHRVIPEEDKLTEDRGKYLSPELYNQSADKSIYQLSNKR